MDVTRSVCVCCGTFDGNKGLHPDTHRDDKTLRGYLMDKSHLPACQTFPATIKVDLTFNYLPTYFPVSRYPTISNNMSTVVRKLLNRCDTNADSPTIASIASERVAHQSQPKHVVQARVGVCNFTLKNGTRCGCLQGLCTSDYSDVPQARCDNCDHLMSVHADFCTILIYTSYGSYMWANEALSFSPIPCQSNPPARSSRRYGNISHPSYSSAFSNRLSPTDSQRTCPRS